MNAADILAIPLDEPGRLYPGDFDEAKKAYRKLAKQWHPDSLGGDDAVFAHVKALHDAAERMLSTGSWVTPGLLTVRTETGGEYEIKYHTKRATEIGETYLAKTHVVYAFNHANTDLWEQAQRIVKRFKFPNPKLKVETELQLPSIIKSFSATDRKFLAVKKGPEYISLRDLLDHFKGKVPPEHVAWIVNRMLGLGVYLQNVPELVHGDVSLDTFFIEPATHRGALLGGWGFAQVAGQRVRALPARSMALGLGAGPAQHSAMATLVRACGVELLGGKGTGSNLLADKSIPKPMLLWLRATGGKNAALEADSWAKVLNSCFGKRKFVELNLKENDDAGVK